MVSSSYVAGNATRAIKSLSASQCAHLISVAKSVVGISSLLRGAVNRCLIHRQSSTSSRTLGVLHVNEMFCMGRNVFNML